jgi:hypothetical protein
MLASPLRHSRIKFAPSPPLYPASHAANLQVYLIPNPGNPVVLFLPWSEQRAKKKRRRSEEEASRNLQNSSSLIKPNDKIGGGIV